MYYRLQQTASVRVWKTVKYVFCESEHLPNTKCQLLCFGQWKDWACQVKARPQNWKGYQEVTVIKSSGEGQNSCCSKSFKTVIWLPSSQHSYDKLNSPSQKLHKVIFFIHMCGIEREN